MENKTKNIFTIIGSFFIGVMLTIVTFYNYPTLINQNKTVYEKNVTITDTGLSESVSKVYNSVAIISNYVNDELYASGSGFIYKIDGNDTYIITNHHVIENGQTFKVTYSNNKSIDAVLVGSDEYTDIAVLKVATVDGYNAVTIGESDKVNPGDTTFVLGTPLDSTYSFTVTRGIISGKERLVEVSSSNNNDFVINVMQTDAAVNSGNSGGPLCNTNGEVIGVVNAKLSGTGIEGMGFAIPIETSTKKADEIISNKVTEYPYIGVSIANVSNLKNSFKYQNITVSNGVYVVSIEKSSPAYGKLENGDIIVKVNDVDVSNIAYFRYELYKCNANDEITITVLRNNKEKDIKIKLTAKNKNI